jgi:hypothetical protein
MLGHRGSDKFDCLLSPLPIAAESFILRVFINLPFNNLIYIYLSCSFLRVNTTTWSNLSRPGRIAVVTVLPPQRVQLIWLSVTYLRLNHLIPLAWVIRGIRAINPRQGVALHAINGYFQSPYTSSSKPHK